jgi:hypothetical protein
LREKKEKGNFGLLAVGFKGKGAKFSSSLSFSVALGRERDNGFFERFSFSGFV